MLRKIFYLLLSILLYQFPLFAAENEPPVPRLYVSPNWKHGEIGTIMIYPTNSLPKVKAKLIDPNGKVRATVQLFPYRFNKHEGGEVAAVAMFGLSPELPSGLYSILVTTEKSNDFRSWETSVFVIGKKYPHKTIRFGTRGSRIQSTRPSKERIRQAKRFYQALETYSPSSIFSTSSLQWPIRARWRSSSGFGERRTFIYTNGVRGGDFHDAQDMAGLPIGTPIYAAAQGRVVLAEYRVVTGYTIIIEHLPGTFTLYYHTNGITTYKGKQVKPGELIGYLGTTGFSTGPHLHFSLRVNGWPVDPNIYVKKPILDKHWMLRTIRKAKATRGR